jgi:hypothetical protein
MSVYCLFTMSGCLFTMPILDDGMTKLHTPLGAPTPQPLGEHSQQLRTSPPPPHPRFDRCFHHLQSCRWNFRTTSPSLYNNNIIPIDEYVHESYDYL